MEDKCCKFHDRLDLKQSSAEYSDVQCGSINQVTQKPDYCCFECPTLIHEIVRGME